MTPRQEQVYKALQEAYAAPRGSILMAATKLGVSSIAVRRWVERFVERGYMTVNPPLGKTKLRFNSRNVVFLKELSSSDADSESLAEED